MLKTLKGKVIAGVAAVLLLAGGTAAFGASDAGAKLKEWFDNQFAGVTDSIDKNYNAYLNSEIGKLDKDVENLIEAGKSDIRNTRTAVSSEAISTIEDTASDHVDSIKNAQEDIEIYMDSEFDRLKVEAEKKILKSTENFKSNANWEITNKIGTFGADNLIFIERQLDYTTDVALKDIKNAIDAAKADLLAQINNKSETTYVEIKASIDASITDTRTFITDLTNDLVIEQQDLIEKKANEMVEDAINEMQDLVDGI